MSGQATVTETVLTVIINEAIVAYPKEANHRLLEFITQKLANDDYYDGVVSRERDQFMESWSRCVVRSKAFGTRDQMKPMAFCQDLISELTSGKKEASKLDDLLKKSLKQGYSDAEATSLQTMSNIGTDLLSALTESYGSSSKPAVRTSFTSDEAIMVHRQHIRGAKYSWHVGGKTVASARSSFSPLSKSFFRFSDLIYGHMDFKQVKKTSVEDVQPEVSQSTASRQILSIVGVKLVNKRGVALNQSRVWACYHLLSEMSAVSGGLGLLPRPLGVDKAVGHSVAPRTGEIIFVFESHDLRHLTEMFGMRLAVFLRQNPLIVLLWCRQLAAAINFMANPDLQVFHSFQLKDLFVREHGLLALGNIAVTSEQSHIPKSNDQKGGTCITDFAASVLISSLCLSRHHTIDLSATVRLSVCEFGEEVVNIMEGCTLDIVFSDRSSQSMRKIFLMDGGINRKGRGGNGDMMVEAIDDMGTASVSVDEVSRSLRVKAVSAGHLLLRTSDFSSKSDNLDIITNDSNDKCENDCDSQSSSYRNVRIVVVAKTPVPSLELIELIALLETSHTSNKPLFLNARCFQHHVGETGAHSLKGLSESEEIALSRDWSAFLKKTSAYTHSDS